MDDLTEMLKGVLEGCVMEIIRRNEGYGYEITRQLNALGFADVVEGTVYTILIRLEKNRWIESRKMPSDMGPPRKLYALTPAGREELKRFWIKWAFLVHTMKNLKGEAGRGEWDKGLVGDAVQGADVTENDTKG